MMVHCSRKALDPLTQLPGKLGELGILLEQLHELFRLLQGECLALFARCRERLAVPGVGIGERFVAVCLTCLCQQDKRRGIGRLEAEREIQQDEGVEVKMRHSYHVESNPERHKDRLGNQEDGCPKEAGKGFGFDAEPVTAEDWSEVCMGGMETEMVQPSSMRLRGSGE